METAAPLSTHLLALGRSAAFFDAAAASFLEEGLARGEAGLVVSDVAGTARILARLAAGGVDVDRLCTDGWLATWDPEEGDPDEAIGRLRAACGSRVRVYCDRANRQLHAGEADSALAAEHAWHAIVSRDDVSWLCPVEIDALAPAVDAARVLEVCRMHGRMFAAEAEPPRDEALADALRSVLGEREAARMPLLIAAAGLPLGQHGADDLALLWLQAELPNLARRVAACAVDLAAAADRVPDLAFGTRS